MSDTEAAVLMLAVTFVAGALAGHGCGFSAGFEQGFEVNKRIDIRCCCDDEDDEDDDEVTEPEPFDWGAAGMNH